MQHTPPISPDNHSIMFGHERRPMMQHQQQQHGNLMPMHRHVNPFTTSGLAAHLHMSPPDTPPQPFMCK
jgi:hypothetical protein